MPAQIPRRSLAARRRTTALFELDENDENENSLNDSVNGRRQSRLLNSSLTAIDEPAQTPRQLVDLYQKTVELASQGKINVKNAFSIPLVERLPQILNVIALDDQENHHLGPNFVKAGSVIDTSAKIYGYRVDALHNETQKLSGNILNTDEDPTNEGNIKQEGDEGADRSDPDQESNKKVVRRVKAKATSFIVTDLSKITLEHEFEFRPLQSPSLCQWRGGIGGDSIYSEMVSSTMYSSSDFPLIDGFTNANSKPDDQQEHIEMILNQTQAKSIDLPHLREVIRSKENHDHVLGNQTLRDFTFNEMPSGSFIDTIHESVLMPMDESIQQSEAPADEDNEVYCHDELVHAAIDDFNDDPSQTNEVFKNALSQLSHPCASSQHSTQANFLSTSILSNMSFADQMPQLLNSKNEQSDYSYFDAGKLKLFAGPNIWKFTNLLPSTNTETSTVQQKQAPITPRKLLHLTRERIVAKRNVRVDIFQSHSVDHFMSHRGEKKSVSASQSSILLRGREKNFNQMQLARKLRALTDLTNFHHFPDLNLEQLESLHRPRDQGEQHANVFDDVDLHDDEPMEYEFIRPIHYEKIEFAKGSSSVNAKILKRQMIEEFTRQKNEHQRTHSSLDTSTHSQQSSIMSNGQATVEFSILCENLADHGYLSLQCDLASAFYCMLINCNENKLYMKSNFTRDDLFIQERS